MTQIMFKAFNVPTMKLHPQAVQRTATNAAVQTKMANVGHDAGSALRL